MQPWKAPQSYFWEEAPFIRILILFAAAICCCDQLWLPSLSIGVIISILAGVTVVFLVCSRLPGNSLGATVIRSICIASALFVTGWTCCSFADIRNEKDWFGNHTTDADAFVVKLAENPQLRARTWKLKVEVTGLLRGEKLTPCQGPALVYIYRDGNPLQLKREDVIIVPAKWTRVTNPGNPFEFDYARFCARNNIYFQQFISMDEWVCSSSKDNRSSLTGRVHDFGMSALASFLNDSSTLGLMQAMLLGDEVNFDQETRQSYTNTGIIHIVAISGSHIAVFFVLTTGLLFWIRNRRLVWVKYALAIPLIWFYVAVAGAPSSAVRAAMMFSLIGLGAIFGKNSSNLNQLFAAAFLILLYQPAWLFSIGFQLSFVAVLSLILFYAPLLRMYIPHNWLLRKIWEISAASLAAEILIAPLVIYYFHLLPLSFLVANIIAYVFMGVVLVLGLILVLFSLVDPLAHVLAFLIQWLVTIFNTSINYLQQLNPASFRHLYLSATELVFVYVAIAGCAFWLLKKRAVGLIASLSAACAVLILMIVDKQSSSRQERFIAYNLNKARYCEIIRGNRYYPVVSDSSMSFPAWDYATREMHIKSQSWKQGRSHTTEDLLSISGKNILILREPFAWTTANPIPIDYAVITYPLGYFDAVKMQELFRFGKLVITGDQKRYKAQQWKDSCRKYQVPAHFTLLDGAFILGKPRH